MLPRTRMRLSRSAICSRVRLIAAPVRVRGWPWLARRGRIRLRTCGGRDNSAPHAPLRRGPRRSIPSVCDGEETEACSPPPGRCALNPRGSGNQVRSSLEPPHTFYATGRNGGCVRDVARRVAHVLHNDDLSLVSPEQVPDRPTQRDPFLGIFCGRRPPTERPRVPPFDLHNGHNVGSFAANTSAASLKALARSPWWP